MSFVQQPEIKWISSEGFGPGASQTISAGGTIEPGDYLVIYAACGNPGLAAQWQAKTGWSLVLNGGADVGGVNPEAKLAIYTRFADGTETDEETVEYIANPFSWSIVYVNYGQNVDPTNPMFLTTPETITEAGDLETQITIPGIVVPEDRQLGFLVGCFGSDMGGTLPYTYSSTRWESRAEVLSTGVTNPTSLFFATFDITDLSFEGETIPQTTVSSGGTPEQGWVGIIGYINRKCGRTTAQVLDQLLSFLPPEYEEATDLLGGIAAQISQQEADGCTLFDLATVARGVGKWLTLHGGGLGFLRGPSEDDDSYRERIRTVEDRVTRPAMLAKVQNLLDTVTVRPTAMIEWYEGPNLNLDPFFLNTAGAALSGGPLSLVILVPDIGNDDSFDDAIYSSISNTLDEIRAAGVEVLLVLAPTIVLAIPNRRHYLGRPDLETTGSIASALRSGFDVFDASNYAIVDLDRLSGNEIKMWAIRFSFAVVPTTDQVLMGSDGTEGVALWVETDGSVELRINDGTTSVSETLSAAITVEVGVEYWAFVQADARTTGGGSEPGFVAIGRVGNTSVGGAATFQPAAGVDLEAVTDEQRIGRNEGLISGSPTESADEVIIHEIREYDSAGDTFWFTVAVVEDILSGDNEWTNRIERAFDGRDETFV